MSSKLITQGRVRLEKAQEDDPAASGAAGLNITGPAPGSGSTTVQGVTALVSPGMLPAPYAASDDDELSGSENTHLAACEAALDNLRVAFWAAGKALQVIRDARLYRKTHDTFEDYVQQRWQMRRAQAYRLIAAWPLAEQLSPIGDNLNESQIRELLPVADRHGQDAAITVYRAVAEADGARVTATVLHGAVGILPDGHFDPAEAVEQIRAYLAGAPIGKHQPVADPVDTFTAQSAKILRFLRRVSAGGMLQAALDADPDVVRRVVAEVRAVLDDIENDVSAPAP